MTTLLKKLSSLNERTLVVNPPERRLAKRTFVQLSRYVKNDLNLSSLFN